MDYSSGSAGYSPAASLTTDATYSVRWAGLLRPQYAEEYTFFARVSGDEDRVKLWVDNSLLVDQWLSLAATERSGTLAIGAANAYFDVAMEYKHVEGPHKENPEP